MASRRVIAGFDNESRKVNSDGQVYFGWRKKPITNLIAYQPTIDLGPKYNGPLLTTGCVEDCPRCRWDNDSHMGRNVREMPNHKRGSTLYLLADVVLHAFHGPPQDRIRCAAIYVDGKPWKDGNVPNCAIDNLRWETLAEAKANTAWLQRQRYMRYHGLHFGRFNYAAVPTVTLNLQKAS